MGKIVKFEILTVGNELLLGRTLNTNAHYLSSRVTDLGGFATRSTTVMDNVEEIASAIQQGLDRGVDWILVCGGLGPTYDDRTLEGVAKALRRPLALDHQALRWLKERYHTLARKGLMKKVEITPSRLKMATLPKGAKALKNPVGSAPAVLIKERGTSIICMPGVPSEMKAIFERSVTPLIRKAVGPRYTCEAYLEVSGFTESSLAPILDRVLSEYPFLYVKSHPLGVEDGVFKLRVHMMATAQSRLQAERWIEKFKGELIQKVSASGGVVREQV